MKESFNCCSEISPYIPRGHVGDTNITESGLLAPEKVTRWPKVTIFCPECSICVVTICKIHFGPYIYGMLGLSGLLSNHIYPLALVTMWRH